MAKKKPVSDEIIKKICSCCGKEKNIKDGFYISHSILNQFTGRGSVCKDCITDIYFSLLNKYQYPKVALYHVCMLLDVCYNETLYLAAESQADNQGSSVHSIYFKNINSVGVKNNTGKTFDESDPFNQNDLGIKLENQIDKLKDINQVIKSIEEDSEDFLVTKEIVKRWGKDLDNVDDYEFLEENYQNLITTYACDTPAQRMLYEEIARVRLEAIKARRNSKITDYEKMISTLSKLMNDLNIKPIQETGASDDGLSTWGQWVKKIEETEPIPEPSETFKDVDNIRKYIDKWFVNHFAKIFGLVNANEIDEDEHIEKGDQ